MNRMKIAAAVASVALLVSGCTYGRDDASKETALEIVDGVDNPLSTGGNALPSKDFTMKAEMVIRSQKTSEPTRGRMEISYDAETSTLKATSSSPDENSTIYLVKNDNNYNAYENIDGLWSKETLNKATFDNALTGATAGLSDLHQLIEDSDDVDVEVTDDYYILSAEPPAGTLTSMTKQFDDNGAEEEAEDAEKGQIEFAIAKNSKKLTAMKVKIDRRLHPRRRGRRTPPVLLREDRDTAPASRARAEIGDHEHDKDRESESRRPPRGRRPPALRLLEFIEAAGLWPAPGRGHHQPVPAGVEVPALDSRPGRRRPPRRRRRGHAGLPRHALG